MSRVERSGLEQYSAVQMARTTPGSAPPVNRATAAPRSGNGPPTGTGTPELCRTLDRATAAHWAENTPNRIRLEPGNYRAWLWREQAHTTVEAVWMVRPIRGRAWFTFTETNRKWAEWIMEKRELARGGRDGAIGRLVNRAADCAIGLLGVGAEYTVQTDEAKQALRDDGLILPGGTITKRGRRTMVHWQRTGRSRWNDRSFGEP